MPKFDDDEYTIRVLNCVKDSIKQDDEKEKLKQVSEAASKTRQFETELFWKRGTYYWAFILAAFTAHFSLLSMLLTNTFKDSDKTDTKFFSLESFRNLSNFALFCLAATALICFFFCLAWTLMNKGSKFWQKNWEQHVNQLEKAQNKRLFATYLNPDNPEYKGTPFSFSAYDYSVSKLALATSILLMVVSFGIFLFYIYIMLEKFGIIGFVRAIFQEGINISFMGILVLLILLLIFLCVFISGTRGNEHAKNDKIEKWHQES